MRTTDRPSLTNGGTDRGTDRGFGAARPLRRRRPVPAGRALVGGFLVAAAVVALFAAYSGASSSEFDRVLGARRPLAVGAVIERSDLGWLKVGDLPAPLRRQSFTRVDQLVGRVVVGPVAAGELIQRGSVATQRPAGLSHAVSFAIESARAVNGGLQPGALVDVLASYGTGADAYTVVVVRGARVLSRHEPRRGLADSRRQVITLGLASESEALAVTHAVDAGTVTLVRSGAPTADSSGSAPASYRAPAP